MSKNSWIIRFSSHVSHCHITLVNTSTSQYNPLVNNPPALYNNAFIWGWEAGRRILIVRDDMPSSRGRNRWYLQPHAIRLGYRHFMARDECFVACHFSFEAFEPAFTKTYCQAGLLLHGYMLYDCSLITIGIWLFHKEIWLINNLACVYIAILNRFADLIAVIQVVFFL